MTGSRGAAHRARLAAVSFARESSDAQVRGSRRGTERSAAGSRVRTGISVRSGAMAGFGRRSALARGRWVAGNRALQAARRSYR